MMRTAVLAWIGFCVLAAPTVALAAADTAEAALFDAAFVRPVGALAQPRIEGLAGFGPASAVRMTSFVSQVPESALLPRSAAETDLAVAVTIERSWPATLRTRRYQLEIIPHAGIGVSGAGQLAEAGASLQVGKRFRTQLGETLNVGSGEAVYGDRGRWYLFGAYKGRAVGLNLLGAGWGVRGDGLTADRGGFMGMAQTGVGWRKGGLQASVGYTYTNVRMRMWGAYERSHEEKMGLSLSYRP
jgi:hypothetical protein